MGSGKTTLGREVARRMEVEFIDLDEEIEKKFQKNIPQLFEEYGEYFFRKQEYLQLKEVLSKREGVLSTGGGTPMYFNSMHYINSNAKSIFIEVEVQDLAKRLQKEKESRPILANKNDDEMQQFIKFHLQERNPYYTKAHFTVKNNDELVAIEKILEFAKKKM